MTVKLRKTVSDPSVAFSADEITAAGGPWKNFIIRVRAKNATGTSAALETKLVDVTQDIRLTGQGALAIADTADFRSQVSGEGKPSDYAGTTLTFLNCWVRWQYMRVTARC